MSEIENRIKQLQDEIRQFETELQNRQILMQRVQNEIAQIVDAIRTRKGGIIELQKLLPDKPEKKKGDLIKLKKKEDKDGHPS